MNQAPIFIIAEAGVNHSGDMELARRLVDAAAQAGADAVKFQTFKAKEIVTDSATKASYQKSTSDADESQLAMLKKLELDTEAHEMLIAHCRKQGIEFLSTPFDGDSLDMLLELGISTVKVPSGEITNLPYLRKVGAKGKPIILSTGMTTLEEVDAAVEILTKAGMQERLITLLHCNTQYPTPIEDANLRAMNTLAKAFPNCKVGYSDHTLGIVCPIAAAAMGARVIEKHFTLDKSMEGPDHAASLDPKELKAMVAGIRDIETGLGSGTKEPSASERENINIARRFLVAAVPIAQGEPFSETNVTPKRTGQGGISPMRWDEIMNKTAPRAFQPGEVIEL
ncbi:MULTISPECIES: N-acetylneuraminate synthase [unclassified Pseudodesulfovibrio]|uniref:N-acetylneuraminate synthase n=1 Tax=unclassified Pseudodesulfovibrio TaxID=2661612 RepID=UPI000FEB617F|nr:MULTISPECIES: N-acetylneuraminate synthase [unclassified Pseudodesulfovibrio]MCJ2164152.1 N-acetylneuraminate synthase [Pseudodesulfovibrio sp. S3-i]RWU05219.1 N-acetylneuraminate synthase [Pseudodesulfovibrio sp. S3]